MKCVLSLSFHHHFPFLYSLLEIPPTLYLSQTCVCVCVFTLLSVSLFWIFLPLIHFYLTFVIFSVNFFFCCIPFLFSFFLSASLFLLPSFSCQFLSPSKTFRTYYVHIWKRKYKINHKNQTSCKKETRSPVIKMVLK